MLSSEEIKIQTINHLGLIAGIIDDIGLEEIINEIVGFDNRELVTAGQVVKAIILNGLGFISKPLYLFPQFFEDKATEHLLGQGIESNHLNDDKIGRVMDRLYEKDLSSIVLKIAWAVVKNYQILTKFSHLDSSSFSVHGKYLDKNLVINKKTEKALKALNSLMKQKLTSSEGAIEIANQFAKSLKYHQITEIKIKKAVEKAKKNQESSPSKKYQFTTSLEINQVKLNKSVKGNYALFKGLTISDGYLLELRTN